MSFFFNFKKTPPTDFQTEFFRWYFTESWKIFTAYAAIIDGIFMSVYFQWEFFFLRVFSVCKTICIFFYRQNVELLTNAMPMDAFRREFSR